MVEMLVERLKADIEETKSNVQDTLAEISTENAESKVNIDKINEFASRVTDIENILKDLQDKKGNVLHIFLLFYPTNVSNL